MNIAINLAKTGIGCTGKNPSVGSVIVNNGEIVSRAVTGAGGSPHSEDLAIQRAGNKANGATMYVTLEPCTHHGNTAPCVDNIINSGIKNVVIATEDPDERVCGGGIKILRENNISVMCGIFAKEATLINIGYFYRKLHNRPFVTLKMATTLDGKIATKNHESKWITNLQSRKFVHKIRSLSDAIMIGKGTLMKDNPSLNCTLPGMENFQPIKIVLDEVGDIQDENLNILHTNGKVLLMGAKNSFIHPNLENIELPIQDAKIKLNPLMEKLAELSINNLLVEGGSRLATDLLKNNLIDKIIWFRSNAIAGNDGLPVFGDLNLQEIEDFHKFSRVHYLNMGSNTVEHLIKRIDLNFN